MNTVHLTGRLTRDPEMRFTVSGKPVTHFTIASQRTFQNSEGEREADFLPCVAWGKIAENVANFLKKGSKVAAVGRLQTGSYRNDEGKIIYTMEVIVNEVEFLDDKKSTESNAATVNINESK